MAAVLVLALSSAFILMEHAGLFGKALNNLFTSDFEIIFFFKVDFLFLNNDEVHIFVYSSLLYG